MYCYNCGKFFGDDELVQRRDRETGLHIYCCPHCGSDDVDQSETCLNCGEDFIEGEISHGYCLECLENAITYDLALEYMNDKNCLEEFMLEYWFETGKLESSSIKFNGFLCELFDELRKQDAKAIEMGYDAPFFEACVDFCLPDRESGCFSLEAQQFAEWYANKQRGDKK